LTTRVSYPVEVKMMANELRLAGAPVREVMEQLNIRNKTQVKTWVRWYRDGEQNRLEQPVGNNTNIVKDRNISQSWRNWKQKIGFLNSNWMC